MKSLPPSPSGGDPSGFVRESGWLIPGSEYQAGSGLGLREIRRSPAYSLPTYSLALAGIPSRDK
jgi:hypothetical protein